MLGFLKHGLVRHVARDSWRCLPDLLLYDLVFKGALLVLITPVVAWVFRRIVASSGDMAIGNFDLIRFFATPSGLLGLLIFAMTILVLVFLNWAGLFYIGYCALWDRQATWLEALRFVGRRFSIALKVSFASLLIGVAAVLPFVLAALFIVARNLSAHDINYYLATRPPEFRSALILVTLLLIGAAVAAFVVYLSVVFAGPLALFQGDPVIRALKSSFRLVRRNLLKLVAPLLGWVLLWWVGSAGLTAIGFQFGELLVAGAGRSLAILIPVLGVLFVLNVVAAQLFGFTFLAVNSLLIIRLLHDAAMLSGIELRPVETVHLLGDRPNWRISGKARLAVVAIGIVAVVAVAIALLESKDLKDQVDISAHRGSSLVAPENTLAAIEQAVEDGTDFVEIDVQRTADGVIVVNHDADLMRLASDPRVITNSTFEELSDVDIGGWFAPEFADQRLPTLEQAILAVRGRARLDVEIKSYAADGRQLVSDVIEILRAHEVAEEFAIMSLNYDEIRVVRELAPDIVAGYVVSSSIGRLASLDVDFLAVSSGQLSESLIATAHDQDKEIWVWTVDRPAEMSRMIDRGVDNIITNTPAKLVEVLSDRAELETFERILLRFRHIYID